MPPVAATPANVRSGKRISVVVPSKVYSKTDHFDPNELEGVEETEITAQISVPAEGGWGWVVVTASFFTIFVLDGVYFTFGSIMHDMVNDLAVEEYLVALINSVAVAVYFIGGPLVSALINKFGFRAIAMTGSMISAVALICTYFASDYATILVLYGLISGFGACLSAMSSGLVVGFYFERLRPLALAISTMGSSFGIMILFTVNTYIVNLAGWRVIMLLHSGLLGTIYFWSMVYRPLLSLTVTTTVADDRTRTVTYLPSLAAIKATPSQTKTEGREGPKPSASERLFKAISNTHFPTAATMVEESAVPTLIQPGPSTAVGSKLILTAEGPQSGISRRQLQQVRSLISKSKTGVADKGQNKKDRDDNKKYKDENKKDNDENKQFKDENKKYKDENKKDNDENKKHIEKQIEINVITPEKPRKRKWWQRLCHWEEHASQARPMYRDDAFYEGRVDQLPVYHKSVVDTAPEDRTGLEYQMAVSRAVTASEFKERRAFFTTAVRRTLATMMDPKLLKRISFLLLSSSGFFTYLGYLVPYVFLPDKNKTGGVDPEHCNLFVSVIGFTNAIGRPVIGAIAMKVNPVTLYSAVCLISGLSIILFNFSFNPYYQYVICVLFGFHIGSLSCVRSVAIVHLFGLDMLTNGTGIMLMFQGLGSLVSTPLSGIIKNKFGYPMSFYVAGMFVLISGFVLVPVTRLREREKKKESKKNVPPEQPEPKQKDINRGAIQ